MSSTSGYEALIFFSEQKTFEAKKETYPLIVQYCHLLMTEQGFGDTQLFPNKGFVNSLNTSKTSQISNSGSHVALCKQKALPFLCCSINIIGFVVQV